MSKPVRIIIDLEIDENSIHPALEPILCDRLEARVCGAIEHGMFLDEWDVECVSYDVDVQEIER